MYGLSHSSMLNSKYNLSSVTNNKLSVLSMNMFDVLSLLGNVLSYDNHILVSSTADSGK